MSRSLATKKARKPRVMVPHDSGIVREFVESVNSSLGCRSGSPRCAEYEWSGGVRDYQARVLADILSHYLAGILTGYVRTVPGTGTSVIESLIPPLMKEAGLGGGLYTIVTPRLVAMTEIMGNIVRILGGTRLYTCVGWGECRDVVGASVRELDDEDASVLIITYQMLVTLHRYHRSLFKELIGKAKGMIFDYPDVNGVGHTLSKVIREVIEGGNKLAIAFMAWKNDRIERLFQGTEFSRVMMADVEKYLTNRVAYLKLPHKSVPTAEKASAIVHRILSEVVGPGTPSPYTTALLVTNSKKRAEKLADHLIDLGHNVVTVSHDRAASRKIVEEQKSRRRIIIETGSLSAGYNHKDVDVLILDTKLSISKYAVYRGIVTRSHNTISRLKAEFKTSIILDISGRNDSNETIYCKTHNIITHKKTARKMGDIPRKIREVIHSGKSGSHLIIYFPIALRKQRKKHEKAMKEAANKTKEAPLCRGLNEAIRIVLFKGAPVKICERVLLVRHGKRIKVLLKDKKRTRYLTTIQFENYDQILKDVAAAARRYCGCIQV